MIELRRDVLHFDFPEVHPGAGLEVSFLRTLRIPDDGKSYPLPPGLGRFPLNHVDDHAEGVPDRWLEHGGVMLPMYQSEAMWISFFSREVDRRAQYPFALKIGAGKINAVNGEDWQTGLDSDDQNYVVVPEQPWLDGFSVGHGKIRQFVAMPLGSGYGAEEQLTGEATWGGLQLEVFPMRREAFEERFPKTRLHGSGHALYSMKVCDEVGASMADMSLAPGGEMKQEIYRDRFSPDEWERQTSARCFVHLANSLVWRDITGAEPPATPVTARAYEEAGLPWFDYYSEAEALEGSGRLAKVDSVVETAAKKGDNPLPENASVKPKRVKEIGPRRRGDEVRVGSW